MQKNLNGPIRTWQYMQASTHALTFLDGRNRESPHPQQTAKENPSTNQRRQGQSQQQTPLLPSFFDPL